MNIEKDIEKFCAYIHLFQIRRGLTLAELAEQSGVPLSMLEQLETGILPQDLMLNHTAALAEALGCQIQELF